MGLLQFQLRALGYPHQVDVSVPETVRKVVIWLENLKIREYKIEDRKPLADTQNPAWDAAFKKYLSDLECPVPAADLPAALHWLVAFATNLEYEDNADRLAPPTRPPAAAAAAAAAAAPTAGPGPGSHGAAGKAAGSGGAAAPAPRAASAEDAFTDLQDPRVAEAVLQLVRAAQITPGAGGSPRTGGASEDVVEQLQAAAQRLVAEVGPASRPGVWTPGQPGKQVLAGVPLGFEVEGEALSAAATALRLLFIRDLRLLQSQIDHAVVEMQEYTANPKTDSSLGKVGR